MAQKNNLTKPINDIISNHPITDATHTAILLKGIKGSSS